MKRLLKFTFLLFCIISLTACVDKKSITSKEFIEYAKTEKLEVVNAKEQVGSRKEMKEAYIALNDNYQIEFYVFDTVENAKKFYAEDVVYYKKEVFTNDKDHNYETYTLKAEDTFVYISRINNTIIYTSSDSKYSDDILKLLNKIGY